MKDMNLMGLNNIKADKELIERTVNKVMNNSKSKNYVNIKRSAAVAASLMVMVAATSFYSVQTKGDATVEVADKIVLDNRVAPSKNIIASDMTSYKEVVDNKVVSSEAIKNSNENSTKNNLATSVAPNKTVVKPNVTPTKPAKSNTVPGSNVVGNNEVTIPAINLNPVEGVHGKMLALVVYNGKVYMQSNTELDLKNIKNFLGEKVGHTINNIDEWNVKAKSSEEMASNIGEQDIYTVNGYDSNFRIMSYVVYGDQEYAQFFDCLNGITIKSGEDIFGKLNLVNNIESAKFIGFEDWNNGTNNYIQFSNMNLINEFAMELNSAVPYNYEIVGQYIETARNNNDFKEVTLKLKDGVDVKFTAFKNGYISYGYSNIYFKVKSSTIDKLWK